jgi:hypothetical protein
MTERCELCAAPLVAEHDHLWELRTRQVRCACIGCAVIVPTSTHAGYRRVPRRLERVELDAAKWLGRLGVPVGVAALYCRDDGAPIAGYPGAIGLVESELERAAWDELCTSVPVIAAMQREVEAVVCAPGGHAWIAGIDVVFKMVSELRARRGVESGVFGDPEAPAAVARALEQLARSHAS